MIISRKHFENNRLFGLLRCELLAVVLLLCLVMGAALFYFRGVYFNHLVFYNLDIFGSEFTLRSYFWSMIRKGLFTPLYPFDSLSHTLLMNPHHKILYPTNLLLLLSDDPYRMAHWDYLLHYGIAALGWYLYFRSLIRSRASAFLSAHFMTFNGVVLSSHYRVEIASFAWVPWAVWGLIKVFETGDFRKALYTGLFFSLIFLGGNPELCGVTIVLGFFSLLFYESKRGILCVRTRDLWRVVLVIIVLGVVPGLILLPLLERAIQDVPLTTRHFGFERWVALAGSDKPYMIFELPGRWFSQLFMDPIMLNGSLKDRLDDNWYASRSIGLFGALCLWFGYAILLKDKKGKLLFFLCIMLVCFSMAKYNDFAIWSWDHFKFFQKFRFPGKIFRYFLILSSIPIALGVRFFYQKLQARWGRNAVLGVVLVAFVNTIQILNEQFAPDVSTLAEKVALPVFTPFKGIESFARTRIGFCTSFLNREAGLFIDGRPRGLAMASLGDATELPGVYGTLCAPELGRTYYDWLGITHLITPHIRNLDILKSKVSMLSIYERIAPHLPVRVLPGTDVVQAFDVIHLRNAVSPSEALFSEYWYFSDLQEKKEFLFDEPRLFLTSIHFNGSLNGFKRLLNGYFPVQESLYFDEEGFVRSLDPQLKEKFIGEYGPTSKCQERNLSNTPLTRFPIQLSSDLSMKIEGEINCPGILSIPWAAISGWRATLNGQPRPIMRVGDTTLGILVPQGKWHIELYYGPKYLGLTLLISIVTFTTIVILAAFELGRIRRKRVC